MTVSQGKIVHFSTYLQKTLRARGEATVWRWADVQAGLAGKDHDANGTLALADGNASDPATIAPGLSLVIQVVQAGDHTRPHSHSFWHLYLVRSGSGTARMGAKQTPHRIVSGDTLFVPAWCSHAIENIDGIEPLILLRLQNLPQTASLGALSRDEGGSLQHLYDEVASSKIAGSIETSE